MEKSSRNLFILLILGTVLFDMMFWKESLGINIFIYDVFVMVSAYLLAFRPWKSLLGTILTASLFSTSIAIVIHSSVFTIIMHYLTFALFIGIIHQEGFNSIIYAFSSALNSFFKFPKALISKIPKNKTKSIKLLIKVLKISAIPIFILWLFYIIYRNANPVFDKLSVRFLDVFAKFLTPLFKNISFAHILFILLGLGLTAWVLFKTELGHLLLQQGKMRDNLIRKKRKLTAGEKQSFQQLKEKSPDYYRSRFALKLKLKYELLSAAVLLILINILLLIVNIIDINWVWFGFKYSDSFDMKQFVHEGTYLLIISILLSMGIMLYFFRRNLNFYSKSRFIKLLTYSWIGQNMILAISVAIRNYLYIQYWGLAYKRIGVIMFLIAVVYGLLSLYIKIRYTKTAYYLIKKNTLAIYLILMISSLINWDSIIAKNNLGHPMKNHMETCYLLSLSDKALPQIEMQKQVLDQDLKYNTYVSYYPYSYHQYYKIRVNKFMNDYKKRSWVSWNYAEWKAYRFYSSQGNE